jgi:ubiquinone/menaquinone biosynthesis C-methylase UbiE
MAAGADLGYVGQRRMDLTEYRQKSYEAWEAMASGWERWRAYIDGVLAPVGDWLVRALAPRPGDTVLELSAGPGTVGFAAAGMVGEHGRVISTDFSPQMVEVARRGSRELGLRNVEHRVMDAERIELESDSVDGVLCRFGYMLLADPEAALVETRRVLRPGGRAALAVWAAPERNRWARIAAEFFLERGDIPRPEPDDPGPFRMASEPRTRALLERAGFRDVRAEEVPVRLAFSELGDYARWATEVSGVGLLIRRLSEPDRQALRAHVEAALASFATSEGYELSGVALCLVAE